MMKVTERTRRILKHRRHSRDMIKDGWERVDDGGGMLWEINRGYRLGQKILACQISLCGTFLWVKIGKLTPVETM